MANAGQIVAALAGGSLLTICTILLVKVWVMERRADQQRRIDTAVASVLAGVESIRHADNGQPPDTAAVAAAEVLVRGHLRLIATQPHTKPGAGRPGRPAPGRESARTRRVRSSRR
ncbi:MULTISPECIES: hypothetical protein [unclassified Streptomyces]|uniref:hypothetical protein n=1 Tax=unclassified Streptomyces TaxID=2593676 RepID=UPI001E57F32B|nr:MULTISPECIES: hypothetical protein [unclassified Streptomyces]